MILDEWREHQRQHGKKRVTVNGTLVAHFLEENAAEEHILLQHQRDLEAQSIREAILGKKAAEEKKREQKAVVELDLTNIPQYEEYR